jgi:hypothetical protein
MQSPMVDEDTLAIGWISLADMLMIAAAVFAAVGVGIDIRYREAITALEQKNTELANLRRNLPRSSEQFSLVVKERDALTRRSLLLERRIKDLEDNLRKLEVSTDEFEVERDKAVATQQELRRQLTSVQSELELQRAEIEKISEALVVLGEFESSASERVVVIAAEVLHTRQQLKNAMEKVDELQRAMSDLQIRYNNAIEQAEARRLSWEKREISELSFRQELLGIRSRKNELGRVVFVVDCSGSMLRSSNASDVSRWEYVCDEIEKWLTMLPIEEAQLILFNDKVRVVPGQGQFLSLGKTRQGSDRPVELLVKTLRSTIPVDATNTMEALQTAYSSSNVDAIFLFTDGVPMLKAENQMTSSDYKNLQDQVLSLIRQQKGRMDCPPVNVIGLGDYFSTRLAGPDQVHMPFGVFLMEIAQQSGGMFLGR